MAGPMARRSGTHFRSRRAGAALASTLLVLAATRAAALPVSMAPDPLVLDDSWADGAMDGSVSLLSGDSVSGELVFELSLAYVGDQHPQLVGGFEVEFDFGPAEVGAVPATEYLVGGPLAIFLSPCGVAATTCPVFQLGPRDPSLVRITVAANPRDLPDGVTVRVRRDLGEGFPVMSTEASGAITVVPEPGSAALLGLGLVGLIVAARCRRR